MFLIMVNYVKSIDEVDKYLKVHSEFLDKYYAQKKFIFSGRRNPRVGGMILANADKREEVEEIVKEDPFYIEGIAKYEIIEVQPTKWDERFSCFVEKCDEITSIH